MKKTSFLLLTIWVLWIITAGLTSAAETKYISDIIQITMRTGPGIDHRVIAMVQSGDVVKVLEEGVEWSRVQLPSGKEGWVLNRFLTAETPNQHKLEQLIDTHDKLETKVEKLLAENRRLKNENETIKNNLESKSQNLNNLNQEYQSLATESADFIQLKKTCKKLSDQLTHQIKVSSELSEQTRKLKRDKRIKWFLGGAGVVFIGFLIGLGFGSRRSKKRSPYL